jgi:mRNA-degrading endonuclease RelE of RelBE toxin-antitoxin system
MTWQLEFARRVPKSLRKLPLRDHRAIVAEFEAMRRDPLGGDVKRLTNHPISYRRRVGDHRILFDLDHASRTVLIHDVVRRSSTTYRR